MYNVSKIYFLQKYVGLFIDKNLGNRWFILFFFLMLQPYSVGYATQQTDEVVEQQNARRSVVKNTGEDLNTLSPEDEEAMPLLLVTRERNKNWKQSWFVKNVIVEFPIIGDFFRSDLNVSDTIKRAVKSTSMLLGGSVGMMMNFIPLPNDDMASHITINSINMGIGMWVAGVTYNTVLSLGATVYQCFSTPHQSS